MRRLAILFAAVAACSPVGTPARAGRMTQAPDRIEFTIFSWGQPIRSWSIGAGGSGNWTEAVRKPDGRMGQYTLIVHEAEGGAEGWRQLNATLARLPHPLPDYDKCRKRMTDAPYGTLRLTTGSSTREITYNSGCFDKPYANFLDTLKAADTLVGTWGQAGAVLRREVHGED